MSNHVITTDNGFRSPAMYAMHEAFARERMSEFHREAAAEQLSRHASAARRWARLQRVAATASERHRSRATAPTTVTA